MPLSGPPHSLVGAYYVQVMLRAYLMATAYGGGALLDLFPPLCYHLLRRFMLGQAPYTATLYSKYLGTDYLSVILGSFIPLSARLAPD